MLSSILTLALLSSTTLAIKQEKRQATDSAQFTDAASQIIDQYIPSSVLPGLLSDVSAAAAAASITGDAQSLLYSALLAESAPAWLGSAIPSEYSTQFAALDGSIEVLRPTATGASPGGAIIPVVIPITTTDSNGNTVTSSSTSFYPSTGLQGAASTYSALTTQVVDGVTSVFSTVVTGVASIGSEIESEGSAVASTYSALTTQVVDGVTSVFSTVVTGVASVGSEIASGGSSLASEIASDGSSVVSHISTGVTGVAGTISTGVTGAIGTITGAASSIASDASTAISSLINEASSAVDEASSALNGATSTSTGGGSIPTGVSGAAAGVIGMLGIMMAL